MSIGYHDHSRSGVGIRTLQRPIHETMGRSELNPVLRGSFTDCVDSGYDGSYPGDAEEGEGVDCANDAADEGHMYALSLLSKKKKKKRRSDTNGDRYAVVPSSSLDEHPRH